MRQTATPFRPIVRVQYAQFVQTQVGRIRDETHAQQVTAARVLVVDDHPVFANALAALMEAYEDIDVVGTVGGVEEAITCATELEPDVAVVDVILGNASGLGLTARLTEELRTRVVVVSCRDDPETVATAIRAGASGFISKDSSTQELVEALRGALRGHTWVSPRLLTGVIRELTGEAPPPRPEEERIAVLSRRERDVLGYLVAGMTRADIAEELLLSVNTIRSHVQRLLTKLNVHSTLEAAALGRRAGVAPPPCVNRPLPRTT
jgi:DNA-binding NarL/FixJ family response regulator